MRVYWRILNESRENGDYAGHRFAFARMCQKAHTRKVQHRGRMWKKSRGIFGPVRMGKTMQPKRKHYHLAQLRRSYQSLSLPAHGHILED